MPQDSDVAWEKWGALDPYYGVVSFPEFKADRFEQNRDRFFEMGRQQIDTVLARIIKFYGEGSRNRVLDFGCGVGRLVLGLARYFNEVVGVDVSDAMLAEAKRNCAESANILLTKSDDTLSRVSGKFDLVHSYVVLQHIPINRGMQLTQKMLELVEDGGVAALHYSIQRTLTPLKALVYGIKHHVPFGRQMMNLIQKRDWNLPVMQMNNYPLPELLHCFERNGFENLIIVPERHSVALTVWIFGKKSVNA